MYRTTVLSSILHDPYWGGMLASVYFPALTTSIIFLFGIWENLLASFLVNFWARPKHPVLIINNRLTPKGFQAITLYPFIICRDKQVISKKLLNHEKIHIKQQKELLIIGFYLLYLFHYAVNLLRYRNSYIAYRHIMFEKEAYANESNLNYLKKRQRWSFWKYC